MAMVDVSEHCMKMNIPEISKLNRIWSPEILIHGVPWKVQVCKKEDDEQPFVGVYLYCVNTNLSSNWSLWGTASFKLLSFSKKVEPIEFQMSTFIFDHTGIGYGKPHFIQWNDLFDESKNYVKNDTIKLEVNVKAENPNDPNRSRLKFKCIDKCCEDGGLANFRLIVTNVANLMAVRSPEFKLSGLLWRVQILKEEEDSDLDVVLELCSTEVSCNMTMSVKLISSKNIVHPIVKYDTKKYHYSMDLNFVQVVSWDELFKPKNGFVNDDAITLEIELNASKPEMDDKNDMPDAKRTKLNPPNAVKSLQMECAVCLECIDNQDLACTPCGHMFCFECIEKEVTSRGKCPSCTTPVEKDTLRQLYLPVIN